MMSKRASALLVVVIGLWGCPRSGPGPETGQVEPEEQADAAVESGEDGEPPGQLLSLSIGAGCVVGVGGRLRCWGNAPGPLEDPIEGLSAVRALDGLPEDIVEVSVSMPEICFRTGDGAVACWGSGSSELSRS